MKHLRKFENFKINEEESVGWISTALLLISLGTISAKDIEENPKEVKEVVDTLTSKDVDTLKTINDIKDQLKYIEVKDKVYSLLELNKSYDIFINSESQKTFDGNFLKFINHVNSNNNLPIDIGVFMIDINTPTGVINLPLYNLKLNINGVSTTLSTTSLNDTSDININLNIKNNFYIGIMTNKSYNNIGFGFTF
jgi:hypothetical protein